MKSMFYQLFQVNASSRYGIAERERVKRKASIASILLVNAILV